MRVSLKRRLRPLPWTRHMLVPLAILLALLFVACLLMWVNLNPVGVYIEMFKGSFGTFYDFSEVLVRDGLHFEILALGRFGQGLLVHVANRRHFTIRVRIECSKQLPPAVGDADAAELNPVVGALRPSVLGGRQADGGRGASFGKLASSDLLSHDDSP